MALKSLSANLTFYYSIDFNWAFYYLVYSFEGNNYLLYIFGVVCSIFASGIVDDGETGYLLNFVLYTFLVEFLETNLELSN